MMRRIESETNPHLECLVSLSTMLLPAALFALLMWVHVAIYLNP